MQSSARTMTGSYRTRRRVGCAGLVPCAVLMGACGLLAQAPAAPEGPPGDTHPIAIVSLDSSAEGAAASVTGDLQAYNGRAFVTANASITAGAATAKVALPYRGTLRVCALTTVKLAAEQNARAGEVPGLLMALDHGAIEMSYAATRNSDTVMTPDFRILISGPGAAEVKVRLGPKGDTCVDNAGANAPYVVVSSVFEGGAYRVQAGQRVMFQHGSLREVVDQEKESCGCPPAEPKGNEFPVAQSQRLALSANPPPPMPSETAGAGEAIAPLIYKSSDHVPQGGAAQTVPAHEAAAAPKAASEKKPGVFRRVGRFFKRIFGAE